MLKRLTLENTGPASKMDLEFGERLNLITGDNGLGKSFLLDIAWWALTRKWPQELNSNLSSGYAARPSNISAPASISFALGAQTNAVDYQSTYVPTAQSWRGKSGRPQNPGVVVYALAEGGFAVWDPARNDWGQQDNADIPGHVPAYVFSSSDVWEGLKLPIQGRPTQVCNGLLADWTSWIREGGRDAKRMEAVLATLAPTEDEPLRPGTKFKRLSLNDARDIPTIQMGYGGEIPIVHASLGVRRITSLAYMLSWAWREHLIAAEQTGQPRSDRVIMLFDEIEAHLHPRWQRRIVPALLKVVQTLMDDNDATVQLIAATHSPLILASVEPTFDKTKDAWFDIDLEGSSVELRKRPYVRMGKVGNWLTSEAFDLSEPRSIEAESAIIKATKLMSSGSASAHDIEAAEAALRDARIPDLDTFWVRWGYFVEQARAHNQQRRGEEE